MSRGLGDVYKRQGVNINIAVLSMAPYLATILALVVISMSRFRGNRGAPGCLGRSFVKTI